jgi:hypothetical protein
MMAQKKFTRCPDLAPRPARRILEADRARRVGHPLAEKSGSDQAVRRLRRSWRCAGRTYCGRGKDSGVEALGQARRRRNENRSVGRLCSAALRFDSTSASLASTDGLRQGLGFCFPVAQGPWPCPAGCGSFAFEASARFFNRIDGWRVECSRCSGEGGYQHSDGISGERTAILTRGMTPPGVCLPCAKAPPIGLPVVSPAES